MEISKRFQISTLIAWIVIVPPGIFLAFRLFPSIEIEWLNLSILFALLFVTMIMPLQLKKITVSFERWITFTIFFQYGVFAEMAFMQIALLILVFSTKSDLPLLHRFFVNSLIFTLVSLASGTLFHYAGGVIGSTDFLDICLFGLVYAISYSVINSVLMQLYLYFEIGIYSFREKFVGWDFASTMLLLPFSISLYFLNLQFGNHAIFLIGIPFLLVLLIARMYNRSDNLNDKLSSAGIIGRELAERLGFEDVIRTFIQKLEDVVPYDNAYVLDLRNGEHLITLMASENGVITKNMNGLSFNLEKTVDDGLDTDNPKIFSTKKEAKTLNNFKFLQSVESVMTAPIKRNQKTEGFLILTSKRKNVFQAMEMKIVDVLTGYFAISLVKARYYEKTVEQSERCGLTKLHNFRYLDAKLDEEIIRFHTGDINSLAVLILDIDHFKLINDTHGHQSGNDLLKALARLLEPFVPMDATLSRYGGEEFVIVLPSYGKSETIQLAEEIRREVESSIFRIIPDLSKKREPVDVHMTVSIGVACVPEDAGDAKELLRNADRALYIGGKQAGRNKVGVYGEKEIVSI
ncbi:GGDEF domain-containing protein [Sporosarcina sp. resist]|uniref:sensor domain-containing diguanylate cyclase n=1 Tax=Sporosarcina sp. resist TaxID=2762563 RepID=UPI00164D612E|nr:GGDEF domain-containing protein [Sporosarcina sp. resist]QNK89947.1 GGDEF domain-containing protein [Sporosarcina sp. resist]